ncbi:tripartite motif-containing protein 16 isoform X2 [Astyanax mexicanus]|uniref:tripartite motif-containing protein 16 isoform X2 n=1 Tax=Astyanax mexicanus TaxID=7994 RepID=UPI0020CAAABD|nr:tripartite motif-containing protein 16 isoform X2 [Astyanax mexicanus]
MGFIMDKQPEANTINTGAFPLSFFKPPSVNSIPSLYSLALCAMMPDSYVCSLCDEGLQDPVTIPCGETFCLECIKNYWDQADHVGIYSCPQCRATFTPRPVLRRNVPNVGPQDSPSPLPELAPFPYLKRDVLCDFCTGRRNRAVKSCLVCLAYYCETHVKPHYESTTFKRHKLVDETGHLDRKICPQHEKGLELFCRSDQMCICVLCTVREHRSHNTVSAEEERAEKQKLLVVTQTEVQHIIQERMKELQELRHNVEVLKAQSYVERLEQEIMELQRRDAELRQILDTEDNIHFLQNFPALSVAPEPMVPKVLINPEFSFGEVTKTATDMKEHLDDICKKEMNNMSKKVSDIPVYILNPRSGGRFKAPGRADLQEPKTRADFLKHAIKLTFDPNTAYKELVLSEGNRRVVRKRTTQFYPEHPERFDGFCQILCAEPLSESRYYWEVEWSGEFSIGVAYSGISRKGKNSHSLLGYNDRSWSLLCSESGYSAWHNKTEKDLPISARTTRIGVYLDFPGNSLSFYSVSESMELIYRFQARFSEPLYAGFGVGACVSLCSVEKSTQTYH